MWDKVVWVVARCLTHWLVDWSSANPVPQTGKGQPFPPRVLEQPKTSPQQSAPWKKTEIRLKFEFFFVFLKKLKKRKINFVFSKFGSLYSNKTSISFLILFHSQILIYSKNKTIEKFFFFVLPSHCPFAFTPLLDMLHVTSA